MKKKIVKNTKDKLYNGACNDGNETKNNTKRLRFYID